jgi:aryl-alcohol dehydrogenase-like predicted oxidoreductase
MNGKLLNIPCPPELKNAVDSQDSAQAYLEFSRSAPGVGAALIGTLSVDHLGRAAQLLERPPVREKVLSFLRGKTQI